MKKFPIVFRTEYKKLIFFEYENTFTFLHNSFDKLTYCIKNKKFEEKLFFNNYNLFNYIIENSSKILDSISYSYKILPRKNHYTLPYIMNIELTTKCMLHCPQCYCDLQNAKDIEPNTAIKFINQAGKLGIPYVNLSGGETLLYPYLLDLIKACHNNGIFSSIAISGYNFTPKLLNQLINAGISGIYISLNASTKELNKLSRDGYDLAINALKILKESNFKNYYINWVAHDNNIDDLKNFIELAKNYNVKKIIILSFKPTSSKELKSVPSYEKFIQLSKFIKEFKDDKISIEIENCYSPLKAYNSKSALLGNLNTGINKGCGAGRDGISIDVNGNLTPCRHLNFPEQYDSIEDYWNQSSILNNLRNIENNVKEPCLGCEFSNYCLPCLDISNSIEGYICKCNRFCSLKI